MVLIRVNVVLNLSYNRHYHVKFNDAARIEILKEIIALVACTCKANQSKKSNKFTNLIFVTSHFPYRRVLCFTWLSN